MNTSIADLKNQLKFLGIEYVKDLFGIFCASSAYDKGECGEITIPGKLSFFLGSIMMHHRKNQMCWGTKTTLMSLPAKTEHSIEIVFSTSEKKEHGILNTDAKDFHVDFKAAHVHNLSSHYLKLSQKLTPLCMACSGGFFPLENEGEKEEDGDNCEAKEEEGSKQ